MDEEADPENVNNVLIQEFSELYSILNSQPYIIIEKLYRMVPVHALTGIEHLASSGEAMRESIKTMLEYFTVASAEECCHFLETVCMLCENVPMHLEMKLMSVAWHGNSEYKMMPEKLTSAVNPWLDWGPHDAMWEISHSSTVLNIHRWSSCHTQEQTYAAGEGLHLVPYRYIM